MSFRNVCLFSPEIDSTDISVEWRRSFEHIADQQQQQHAQQQQQHRKQRCSQQSKRHRFELEQRSDQSSIVARRRRLESQRLYVERSGSVSRQQHARRRCAEPEPYTGSGALDERRYGRTHDVQFASRSNCWYALHVERRR